MNGYTLEQADNGGFVIKHSNGKRYLAGLDESKAQDLVERLNSCHRPNIHYSPIDGWLYVCWNNHEKYEPCQYEPEIKNEI